MPNRLTRTVRILLLLGAGIAITLVLVPTAISIGTGGHLPAALRPLAEWLWPLAGLFVVFAAALALWERATTSEEPLIARRLNNSRNRSRSVQASARYARDRIRASLAEHVRIALGVEQLPAGMARAADRLLQPSGGRQSKLPADADLAAALDEAGGKLLVLGEPGAGKSTLLLELNRALADRAAAETSRPIPVLIDLGSWAMSGWRTDDRRPAPPGDFQKWLLREVERRYKIHPSLGRIYLEQGRFGLLLDGLDEVPPEYRDRCVREINKMRDAFPVSEVVVCCRPEDHAQLTEPLELGTAITVNTLSKRQVLEYATRAGAPLDGVRSALRRDPELWQLLNTPLMLNIAALAYRDGSAPDLTGGTPQQRRRRLFDDYIAAVLRSERGAPLPYPPERALRTLKFLAKVAASPLCNDLTARTKLPTLVSWAQFLPTSTVAHVFARALPGMLAGAVTGTTLAVGMVLGPTAGLITALVLVGYVLYMDYLATLPWLRPAGKAGPVPQGWVTALGGYVFGLVVSLALCGLITPWTTWVTTLPTWVGVVAVLVVSFLVILSAVESWSRMPGNSATIGLIGTVLVGVLMFWTGPDELLISMGIGLVLGTAAGVVTAARDDVWWAFTEAQYDSFEHKSPAWLATSAPLVAAAGLVGAVPSLLTGRPFDVEGLTTAAGLLVGGLTAPAVWHSDVFPFDSLKAASTEWLGRAIALTELPPRRFALLRGLAERSLLSRVERGYRFPHVLMRDHLLGPRSRRSRPKSAEAAEADSQHGESASSEQPAESSPAESATAEPSQPAGTPTSEPSSAAPQDTGAQPPESQADGSRSAEPADSGSAAPESEEPAKADGGSDAKSAATTSTGSATDRG